MKICLAQINTTPGDFDGNVARIFEGVSQADAAGADIVLFPELTIPGYLTQDLIYNEDYVARNLAVLDDVVARSAEARPDLHIVVGYIDRNAGVGKPYTNMAAIIAGGQVRATYQKQLLPFYDVFDELRYFEPGDTTTVVNIAGLNVGIAICEDLWNDKDTDDYNYADNPYARYRDAGVDVVLSLNSSPYVHDKFRTRLEHIAPPTQGGPAVIYVNQVGGQDELVFDGQSFVVKDGKLAYLSDTLFEDSFDVVDLGSVNEVPLTPVPLEKLLVLGLKDYMQKSGFSELVLASSGGVDSAVVCKLACDAVAPENVHAIRMPSIYSSDHSRDDALTLHQNLGCRDYEVPIEHLPVVEMLGERYRDNGGKNYNNVADENIQARLRDLYLMHFSNAFGAMPLSTGNKTESGCGYYTHFDMNFSYAPIKDLYKFQVVDIAKSDDRIPANIWQKPPSAELAHGQIDEASLLPYAVLDPIVLTYIEHYITSFEKFAAWCTEQIAKGAEITSDERVLSDWLGDSEAPAHYQRIISLIGKMEYKRRQTCPGTKVSKVAFGIGRRIPIVEKWS